MLNPYYADTKICKVLCIFLNVMEKFYYFLFILHAEGGNLGIAHATLLPYSRICARVRSCARMCFPDLSVIPLNINFALGFTLLRFSLIFDGGALLVLQ